jgi:pantoate--beta-alanine ligase
VTDVVRTVAELRARVIAWRRAGEATALIPTMGYLHDGHLALVARGRELARRTIVTLFVNPTQFSPSEDLERYPRDEAGDLARLASVDCDLLYAPDVSEMYPPGFATSVTVSGVSDGLCGVFRPKMFAGVALVVTKLLIQAQPDVAVFGEKDYQQLQVIRRFVRDLDIPVPIVGIPTVRESDGVALSSRNSYLTPEERLRAPTLYQALTTAAARLAREGGETAQILAAARDQILAAGFSRIDYFDLCDAETLAVVERVERPARLLAAAWLGKARLIDNIAVSVPGAVSVPAG